MKAARSLAVIITLLAVTGVSSCRKRPAGSCAEDIDCPAGYDCRAGACIKRPPAPGTAPAAEPADPSDEAPTGTDPAPVFAPRPLDAGPAADAPAPSTPAKRKSAPAAPTAPPPTMPPPPPQGPLPMWKQRLKNS